MALMNKFLELVELRNLRIGLSPAVSKLPC